MIRIVGGTRVGGAGAIHFFLFCHEKPPKVIRLFRTERAAPLEAGCPCRAKSP
jgi:hypothetical protein